MHRVADNRFYRHLLAIIDWFSRHGGDFLRTPLAYRLVLLLFVAQAVVLVFAVHIGNPPDETNHINFIEYYAHHSLSPILTHQKPTYSLGDKTREVDYLYHYSMSLVYRALPVATATKYHLIRLVSVAAGLASFIALGALLRRLGVPAAVRTVSLFIVTNLPMVLMMSAAINNDVFVWLGTLLGLLLLLRLWQSPRLLDLMWLLVIAVTGGLVKRTMLPLGLLFAVLGCVVLLKHRQLLWSQLQRFDWRYVLAGLLILISLGLFAERVGGNVLTYHTITPSCEQVDGSIPCAVFWSNARAQALAQLPREQTIPLVVFPLFWAYSSFTNVIDVQTQYWLHEVQPAIWLTPLLVLLLLTGLWYGLRDDIRHAKTGADRAARWRLAVTAIALYFMVIHLAVNYQNYEQVKFFGIALNGRYIIPSILPLAGLAALYWTKLLARRPRRLAVMTGIVMVSIVACSGMQLLLRNPQLYVQTELVNTIEELSQDQ